MEATVDLLCRWARGESATARRLRADWLWSNDRVTAHIDKIKAWAEVNGARIVRSDVDRTSTIGEASPTVREPSENRPERGRTNAGNRRATVREPSANRPKTVQPDDPPRVRVEDSFSLSPQREKKREEPEDKGPRSAPASPPPSVHAEGGKGADDPDMLRAWAALCEFKLPGKRDLTAARRPRLAAALRLHGIDALLRVGRWAAKSGHDRAAFLRARCDVDTLLWASKLQAYVELSTEPDVDPRALAAFERWRTLSGFTGEPTPALAAPILSAIGEVGEADTILVIEWVLGSEDERAKFLRSKSVTSLAGILRPDKLRGRVELARSSRAARVVTQTTTGAPAEIDLGPNAILGRSPTAHLRRR